MSRLAVVRAAEALAQLEVDQFTRRELEVHFDVDGRPPVLDGSRKRSRPHRSTMPNHHERPALQALKSGS